MIQEKYLDFVAPSGMVAKRFVTITPATGAVAYTAALGVADAITIGDESNLKVAVQLLGDLHASFWFDSEDTIALGGNVEVGTDGKGRAETTGAVVCLAKIASVAGSFGVGYNK